MAPKRNKQSKIYKQRQNEMKRVRTYTAVYNNIPSVHIQGRANCYRRLAVT